MIATAFDAIDKATIDELVSNRVEEGRLLDYKAALPTGSDKDRKDFAADVASFANTAGGHLVYGVSEERDGEGKNTGFPGEAHGLADNVDDACRRLEQMARANVEPPIPALRIRAIAGFERGSVIVVYVPRSWNGPHMVRWEDSRFHSRGNKGKHSLTVTEIRAAFLGSAEVPERIRRFRDNRLGRIIADETPVPIMSGVKVVLHLVPFASLDLGAAADLATWEREGALSPMGRGGWTSRYNLDGFVSFRGGPNEPQCSYVQLFRSGVVEHVSSFADGAASRRTFNADWIELNLLEATKRYLALMKSHAVDPPVAVVATVLGVRGATLDRSGEMIPRPPAWPVPTDELLLPDVLVQSAEAEATQLLRPVFDALWQAGGERCSPSYDRETGEWTRRR